MSRVARAGRLVVLAGIAFVGRPVYAATYNVTFCFNYDAQFGDASSAVGDDFFTSNAVRRARGIYYEVYDVTPRTLLYHGYTPWDGASTGCTDPFPLDSGKWYDAVGTSIASVNGNYLKVYDDDSTPSLYGFGVYGYMPTASGTVTATAPAAAPGWNIASAAAQAMYRRNVGLSGETVVFYTQMCPSATNGSCNQNGEVYIQNTNVSGSGPNFSQKYLIVHEMGHAVATLKNGGNNASTTSTAPLEGCGNSIETDLGHRMVTKEYQSTAANEGIANYYAAVAFNNTTDGECRWQYYKSVDWDLDGNYNEEVPVFSCEGAGMWFTAAGVTYPYTDADWLVRDVVEEKCLEVDPTGETRNRATELDWLRFFWDLDHDQGVTTTKIFDIWNAANPHTWLSWGEGSSDVCATTVWPSGRLRSAADSEGVLTEWDAEFTVNGVHR